MDWGYIQKWFSPNIYDTKEQATMQIYDQSIDVVMCTAATAAGVSNLSMIALVDR